MAERGSDPSLGGYLRSLRCDRGVSIEELARATKVSVRQLEALESDRIHELPAPVFVRGFVRAYCQALGHAPDGALRLYARIAPEWAPPRGASLYRGAPASTGASIAISLALVAVLGLGLLAVNAFLRPEGRVETPAPQRTAGATTTSPLTPPAPAAPSARAVAGQAPRSQRLVVRAIEPTWLRVQVDEGRVEEDLLAAGTTREWRADKRFLLTVGNAGGIEVELNGQPMPPLGARGVVIRQLELPRAATGS